MLKKREDIILFNQKIHCQWYLPNGCAPSPTLVFLHDALGSVAQWGNFPGDLALRCGLPAMAYDRPGHGRSSVANHSRTPAYMHLEALSILPALLAKTGVRAPILIGHSDGGSIVLIYAAHYHPTAIITFAAHVVVEQKTLAGIRETCRQRAKLIRRLTPYHNHKTRALFDAWADTWLHPSFQDWRIDGLLPCITCPALLFQGEQDAYATPGHLEMIARGIGPLAETELVPDCGHLLHSDCPEPVLDRIAHFLRETQGRAGLPHLNKQGEGEPLSPGERQPINDPLIYRQIQAFFTTRSRNRRRNYWTRPRKSRWPNRKR